MYSFVETKPKYMDLAKIHMCRECRASYHKLIKNAKNAILENERNRPKELTPSQSAILEDYVYKNTLKKPEHLGQLARIAVETKKTWNNGRHLSVAFLGGSTTVRERVKRHASYWMDFANIQLDFNVPKNKTADVRIAFNSKDGSWSYVGTEILTIDPDQPTMNYGWLTETTDDEEYHRTVLHEFGHTLGCIHEHSSPLGGVPWDKAKAYQYYQQTQGWSKAEVDEQVFKKYSIDQIRGTKVDKHSIMMYPIPNEITIGNFEVGWNNDLSAGDKKFMSKMYPKK
jgi:hypothetical protein